MRVNQLFGTINWRSAVGEVILIVVGVTIALAGNSWYENRQLRQDEAALHVILKATIGEDLVGLQSAYDVLSDVSEVMRTLAPRVDRLDAPDLNRLIGTMARFTAAKVRFGPYETLKARGFGLISDPVLRAKLTSLYEDVLPSALANLDRDETFLQNYVLPLVLANFRLSESSEWVLKDSPSLDWQADLATLETLRRASIETWALPTLRAAMDQMSDVIEEIE